jgi:hypothetical protein
MKTLLIAAAAAALIAPGVAAAADLSGAWKLVIAAGDMTFNINCDLKQQAAALSGTCTPVGIDGAMPSAFTGTVDGATAKWAYDVDFGGNNMHLAYTANLKSDTAMEGTVDAAGNAATFTGAKQ